MVMLKWDEDTKRLFENGVDQGVLYLKKSDGTYDKGVAWNGLTKVSESPEGAESTAKYANNKKYLNLRSEERFKGQISAYTYPQEWNACQGKRAPMSTGGTPKALDGVTVSGQARSDFGLSYRTRIGNDTEGLDHGYILHLVYSASAGVSSKEYQTINESPDALEFSWDFDTVPTTVAGMKPTAHIEINSTLVDKTKLADLEKKLYGDESGEATLPKPEEVFTILGLTAG